MKLKLYLINEGNEKIVATELEDISDKVQNDCSQICKFYRIMRSLFFRGERMKIYGSGGSGLIKKQSRLTDRTPLDTPKDIHELMNRAFKKKFGWKVRNGVFVSSSYDTAHGYGRAYIFFPFDGFKYCWSPTIVDFYSGIYKMTTYDFTEKYEPRVLVKNYTDKGLGDAVRSNSEVSFNTKYYYLLNTKHYGKEYDDLIRKIIG